MFTEMRREPDDEPFGAALTMGAGFEQALPAITLNFLAG